MISNGKKAATWNFIIRLYCSVLYSYKLLCLIGPILSDVPEGTGGLWQLRDFEGEVKREDLVEMAHGNQMFSLEEKKIVFLKIATKQATNAPCT